MRHRPVFCFEKWVHVDDPHVGARVEAESAARDPSRKQASKKDDRYQVLRVQNHTLTVDIRGIDKVVSIDRFTLTKTHQEAGPATEISQRERADGTAHTENCLVLDDKDGGHPQIYTIEKLVADLQQDEVVQHRVRFYGYAPEKNSWESSKHIFQHFVNRVQNR